MNWTDKSNIEILYMVLETYEPTYNLLISSSSGLNRMHLLSELLSSKEHVHINLYHSEIWLCGKDDTCSICRNIGRKVRNPVTVQNEILRNIVLNPHTLPMEDNRNPCNFFKFPTSMHKSWRRFVTGSEVTKQKEDERDKTHRITSNIRIVRKKSCRTHNKNLGT